MCSRILGRFSPQFLLFLWAKIKSGFINISLGLEYCSASATHTTFTDCKCVALTIFIKKFQNVSVLKTIETASKMKLATMEDMMLMQHDCSKKFVQKKQSGKCHISHLVWRMLTVTVISTITSFTEHELIWISRSSTHLQKVHNIIVNMLKCSSRNVSNKCRGR